MWFNISPALFKFDHFWFEIDRIWWFFLLLCHSLLIIIIYIIILSNFLSIFGRINQFFFSKTVIFNTWVVQNGHTSGSEIFFNPFFSVFSLRFRLISGTWSWWHQCCTSIQYQKFSQQEIDRARSQRVADVNRGKDEK